MNWTRIAIVTLGSGWFFLASCTTGLFVATPIVAKVDARDAASGDTMHSHFSVVTESAQGDERFIAVNFREMERFENSSGYYLLSRPSGSFESRDSDYSFEVLEETASGQIIEVVEAYKDGDNTVWSRYEATATSVTPISSRMFYFGYAFAAMPYAFGFAFVLYVVGRVIAFRNPGLAKPAAKEVQSNKYGLPIFIVVYMASLIVMYVFSTPTETADFSESIDWDFTVAGVVTGEVTNNRPYRVLTLGQLNSTEPDLSDITFLLPRPTITINVGDIHRVEILENHDDWQLVAFHYSNTRTSTAIYRAYTDRVEPVSYRVTSSAAHLFYAVLLLFPAYLLARIITPILNWIARRVTKSPG